MTNGIFLSLLLIFAIIAFTSSLWIFSSDSNDYDSDWVITDICLTISAFGVILQMFLIQIH